MTSILASQPFCVPCLRPLPAFARLVLPLQQALTQRRQALKDMENECPPQDKVLLSRVLRPLWAQLDEAAIVYRNVQKALSAKTGQKRKQAQ